MQHQVCRSARVVQVIETVSLRGDGSDDPVREVRQYWSFEGELLAEKDPAIGPPGIDAVRSMLTVGR